MKYLNIKNIGTMMLFVLLGSSIYVTYNNRLNTNNEPYKAEFSYSEKSLRSDVIGSVMPASCGSYAENPDNPEDFPPHTDQDRGGHCIETCPSDRPQVPQEYKICRYKMDTFVPGDAENPPSTLTIHSFKIVKKGAACPTSVAPMDPTVVNNTTGNFYDSEGPYWLPVCSYPTPKTCLSLDPAKCTCNNGAINPPAVPDLGVQGAGCNICPQGQAMNNGTCTTCENGGCSGYPPRCVNGATNEPSCSGSCRTGYTWDGDQLRCVREATPCIPNRGGDPSVIDPCGNQP